MELTFDFKGYLTPYNRIELTLEQFEETFVGKFPSSTTRPKNYQCYLSFLEDFKTEITGNFTHWINGSFTTKKNNPRDIDFATLIEYQNYERNRELIDSKYRLEGARKGYHVDAYTVEIYPESHEKYLICKADLLYWDAWFRKAKKNRAKKSFPKGYIEIKFGEN